MQDRPGCHAVGRRFADEDASNLRVRGGRAGRVLEAGTVDMTWRGGR